MFCVQALEFSVLDVSVSVIAMFVLAVLGLVVLRGKAFPSEKPAGLFLPLLRGDPATPPLLAA